MKTLNLGQIAALFMIIPALLSCNTNSAEGTETTDFISGDFSPPKLVSIDVLDGKTLKLGFSKEITPVAVQVGEIEQQINENAFLTSFETEMPLSFSKENKSELSVVLEEETELGKYYGIQGSVTDNGGNALTFNSVFAAYNDRMPDLILSEIQTDMKSGKSGTPNSAEFVELFAQTSGNLAGMCLYSAYDGETCRYEFPAVEVQVGEYITLHMRKLENVCLDELEDDLTLSGGNWSSDTARDLWVNNNSARLGKTDVILLEERKNGKVMDALFLSEQKKDSWPKNTEVIAANRAVKDGAWKGSADISSAVSTANITTTRSISRQGNLMTAGKADKNDWLLTATGTISPGKPNSTKPFKN